jgi:hypothetical protein
MLPVSSLAAPLADYVALLEDIWQSRMLSNFGKYARRFEEKAQAYFEILDTVGGQLRSRSRPLDRRARDPRGR